MRTLRYLLYGRQVFKTTMAEMPWNRLKLRRKGSKFVFNYSDKGNARLTVWLCEGDKVDVVPVSDRTYDYAFTVEKFCEYKISGK
ncbi:hypothetical protein ACFLWY_05620, partial [Chloroflexota bacterium]